MNKLEYPGSEANNGFGHASVASYLGMCLPKAAFLNFQIQPMTDQIAAAQLTTLLATGILLRLWFQNKSPT